MPNDMLDDLVRGVKNIAPLLKTSERAAYHLLENGQVPGAFKLGGRTSSWILSLSKFREGIEQKMPKMEAAE
jgi:predicted DNA-binding transcriptional regulator AlpA